MSNFDIHDERYIVVFMEDGNSINQAKAFKYNLAEKLALYTSNNSNKRVLSSLKRRHNSVSFVSQRNDLNLESEDSQRAFKELLEECSRILTKN